MLQKIYWLGHIQSDHINNTQEFRTFFCKHEFPHLTFLSPAFAMVGGGLVSNAYAWTLAINNCSIFVGAGSVVTPVDEVCEQIRLLMILRMNLFFGQSPEEVEQHCNTQRSTGKKILPDVFTDTRRPLHEEIKVLNPWFQKVLSLPRQKYLTICQALTAYERALHVFSSDPTLAYSLLVFVIEALANSHSDYQATWGDLSNEQRNLFDTLFEDNRISPIDDSWTDDLRKALVEVVHPGATRRFTKFALDHIPINLYDASKSDLKSPLRRSRIHQGIQNAYKLRSDFSHALRLLPQSFVSESYRAEEVEQEVEQKGKKVKTSYLTLRGLFRVVRSIVMEFIEQQETVDLRSHAWIEELDQGVVRLFRSPAYLRMKNPEGQLYAIEAQYAQNWFEDILDIYQDNYVECLHEQISENRAEADLFMGIATSGPMAGRAIFRFDPSPSYDWESLKEQSLHLLSLSQAKKEQKGYLQAIALLCAHLEMMDGKDGTWDAVLTSPAFGDPLLELGRFVVDVIHDKTQHWSSNQAEEIFEKHLKKRKVSLSNRLEVACMLYLARLFKSEGSDEGRRKWLNTAYGDTALYPSLQSLIQDAINSNDIVVEPQEVLNLSRISS
ncbi:hypothetical protein ACSQ6I_09275 [Anabaena sp. WFMT]|uniref:hypothetical protein n=1 Tax=Anabaena sp. WFMT TaxID=3449730 RepID=UPI003F1FDF30